MEINVKSCRAVFVEKSGNFEVSLKLPVKTGTLFSAVYVWT